MNNYNVHTATGKYLSKMGKLCGIKRRFLEPDYFYRKRLLSVLEERGRKYRKGMQ